MLDDLEFLQIDLAAGYRHDDDGWLCPEGADGRPGCRFLLARTAAGDLRRYRRDLPATLVAALEETARREPPVRDLRAPLAGLDAIRCLLAAHAPLARAGVSLVYRFPRTLRPDRPVVEITADNLSLAAEMFPDLAIDPPCIAVVEEGRAVSVCQSAGSTPRVHVAGLDTMAAYRGRGYAAAVVAGWGNAVRSLGKIPLYSTWLENEASQRAASKAGLRLYGAVHHFT